MLLQARHPVAALFFVLLAGAVYFALERMLFADASFILFRLINDQSLQIQEHRYGSFITQGLALLAIKCKVALPALVRIYSLSFNLFYLTVALLLLYRFKQVELAMLMAFYFTLFVSDTYFWANNEVHQGIAWMFILFAFTRSGYAGRLSKPVFYAGFTVLGFLTLYTHPLLVFPTCFLFLFLFTNQKLRGPVSKVWPLALILIAIAGSKFFFSTGASSHYDAQKLEWLTHPSIRKMLDGLQSPLPKELLVRTFRDYWIVPVLAAWGLLAAIRSRDYTSVLLTIGFSGAYILALCLTYRDFLTFYMESELMSLSVIVTTPFVFLALPRLRPPAQMVLLAGIFIIRLLAIYQASSHWTARKDYVFGLLHKMEEQHINKALIDASHVDSKGLIIDWGHPRKACWPLPLVATACNAALSLIPGQTLKTVSQLRLPCS